MRKILLLALTGALLVAMSAGTATAKGPDSGKGASKGQSKGKGPATVTYVFKGQMASVAEDGSSFEIAVSDGNKAGRSAVASGEPLSLTVVTEAAENRDETRIELNDQEATMADLQAGDDVVVQAKGHKGDTSFIARVISAERAEQSAPADESAPADNGDSPAS